LPREDYLIVQHIYRGWALLGIVIVGAILSTLVLTIMVRRQPNAFLFTLIALFCLLGAQALFWTFTYPANQAPADWTLPTINWDDLRNRWELSHAVVAILVLMAQVTLILSVLVKGVCEKNMQTSAEDFPSSSPPEQSQGYFLQDVAMFHSSWYAAALDEFQESTEIEPELLPDGALDRGDDAQSSDLRRAAGV